ncbi:MATE family efflux transporter [Velocimicrobium porci]|uniref:Multidrug export protein MepA n=1 Tax=Velocimicrobium porci TaxID=2606634 RepID=A0A6L5Y0C2_9FIRM|nr:MATE family efflux transporter [Velocimicrobium porci]MSS63633.1 MATE family efflux transporter [Velocimicrobium porci]
MTNQIAKEFNIISFLKFVFPTIIMMLFMALYSIIDGMFVSRFVGSNALSAVNIVYPIQCILIGIGIMFGTGGSAVVAKKLGEGKDKIAREYFTLLVCFTIGLGLFISILMLIFLQPILVLLGANETLYSYCFQYGSIILLFGMPSILQILFQSFFVTAGKPKVGLILTIISGVSNIIFDYIFIVLFKMGISGAALGTAISYFIGFLYPLFYFRRKVAALWFMHPKWNMRVILQSMGNGSSEMVSNLAAGVTTFLFNIAMLRLLGENGVAAITIVLYSQFLFTAAYLGFSNGAAPIISFNYGSGNSLHLQKIYKMCMLILTIGSFGILLLSLVFAGKAVGIFVKEGSEVYKIALYGYRIFAWNFMFAGFNIFVSSFFTALSNGKISAFISFLRTFAIEAVSLTLLPRIMGVDGVWLAVPIAEGVTLLIAAICLKKYGKVYHYFKA